MKGLRDEATRALMGLNSGRDFPNLNFILPTGLLFMTTIHMAGKGLLYKGICFDMRLQLQMLVQSPLFMKSGKLDFNFT
jgi:hypothetical protein